MQARRKTAERNQYTILISSMELLVRRSNTLAGFFRSESFEQQKQTA